MGIYFRYFMGMNGTMTWYPPKSFHFLAGYQVIVSVIELAKG